MTAQREPAARARGSAQVSTDSAIRVFGVMEDDHPSFAGHFPGAPLTAGVVVLGRVLQAFRQTHAHWRIVGVASVKFPAPLLPGDAYVIEFERRRSARVSFECRSGQVVVARGDLDVESPPG